MGWRAVLGWSVATAMVLATCSGSQDCTLGDAASCPGVQVCEQLQGQAQPRCFQPVVLQGKVFDLSSGAGLGGADVTASDENGAPVGATVKTNGDGTYSLRIPSARTDDQGAFQARKVMLRSQAKNFVAFPSGARVSLPIDTATAAQANPGAPFILKTAQTDIGLSAVPSGERDLPSVSGSVEVSADQAPVLVAMEDSQGKGRTVLAGPGGSFSFFNVPAGAWKLGAYSRGASYVGQDLAVQAQDVAGLSVKRSAVASATLSGKVQLVAGAAPGTSVVLALESTFIASTGRGDVVPGLRAPDPGTPPTLTGDWTISGIPDGRYVVLAAFENDGNVRDPDPGISGTQIQHVVVSGGSIQDAVSPSFKVTAAVELVGPGKDGPEGIPTATPTFAWTAYPNADAYVLEVFDALGSPLWTKAIPDKSTTTAVYDGPALTRGQVYQWRATALRKQLPTSMTEELRGVIFLQ